MSLHTLHFHWSWLTIPAVGLVVAMEFTPSDISAMAVAIGSLIAAISLAVVNVINARAAAKKLDAVVVEVAAVSQGNAVIKGIVDGAASRSDERERALLKEIGILKDVIAEKKETAAVLAQAATTQAPTAAVAPVDGHEAAVITSLEQIKDSTTETAVSTAETARNTARTDATMQDMKDKNGMSK